MIYEENIWHVYPNHYVVDVIVCSQKHKGPGTRITTSEIITRLQETIYPNVHWKFTW
jgi:hypothetical protein